MYLSYPNQKKIIIAKEPCDSRNIYAKISIKAMKEAMCKLKPGELKLWFYLAKNINGHIFDLSQVDCENYGLKKDAYHDAVNGLIEKKYLQWKIGNEFVFKEMPA